MATEPAGTEPMGTEPAGTEPAGSEAPAASAPPYRDPDRIVRVDRRVRFVDRRADLGSRAGDLRRVQPRCRHHRRLGPGTGDGFARFCAGETDISDASRPISAEEVALCEEAGVEFIELKVAVDGLSVITARRQHGRRVPVVR